MIPSNFIKLYIRQLPRIFLRKDGFSNTLSLRKTLWINYKYLDFKQARKLPIWIYRYTKFSGNGEILINNNCIYSGMIKIGNIGNASRKNTIIENAGTIEFKDKTSLFRGNYIMNNGTIIFEGNNLISEGCTLKIMQFLKIGKMSIVGSETYIIDTDFHYCIDLNKNQIKRCSEGIVIGECNWIATNTFIKKGVRTGFGFVAAAAYTVLTKDYSGLPEYTVVGGNPAKPIAQGLRGIFNEYDHHRLDTYFESHRNDNNVSLEKDNSMLSDNYFQYIEFE